MGGQVLDLTLVGASVYNLNCEHKLESVAWISAQRAVAAIEVHSKTAARIIAVKPGDAEIYADVTLIDGRHARARGYGIGEGTVATVRVVR